VAGVPTPRSDADLLVILSESNHPEPRDRVPEVLRALRPLPCPVDLFVLTSEELDRYSREGHPPTMAPSFRLEPDLLVGG
jgi:predicted nucleotidyltransferase